MADPPVANCLRAQAIFQGVSGLAEDRYVNTFHFLTSGAPTLAMKSEVHTIVNDFYAVDHSGAEGLPIVGYMSQFVIDAEASEVRVYDMSEPTPREPDTVAMSLPALGTQQALPAEVAVCMSYYSQRNIPSRRGRIYLGPLTVTALSAGAADSRPHAELRGVIQDAGAWLIDQGGSLVSWAVLAKGDNPTTRTPLEITNGWVDDAWDTQRRRGAAPTGRLLFS